MAVDLYDELIDVGGHFNMPAFQASARVTRDGRSTTVHFTAIGGDDSEVADALNRLLRTNIVCLRVFGLVFRELWAPKGFSARIDDFGSRV
jgi:hypothetical protein